MIDANKPVRRKVLADVMHGVNPKLVITIYPNSEIGIRELRRRTEYRFDSGKLYTRAVINEATRKRKRH